ncbi:MAG: 16S rRNA (adenine(1518)-N(6)/adenine(1519)-N(6))-dimethyltransferase RsmA [Acidobacteriota bacterium]|jgi:16S rRNA (adenine1518-N6/adenine1519-N6)-dimethyltransferase
MKNLPKKRYGQHFLRDTGILDRIVTMIQPGPADLMLEVGAGDGALSRRLAPRVLRLFALELDRDLIPDLQEALAPCPNAEVIKGDVLRVDLCALLGQFLHPDIKLRIAGNLPYNIGTAIIERLIELRLPIADMVFMLQRETAMRINAVPRSQDYGFFSVYCQHHCEIEMGFRVSPACFVPRPKVQSAMIRLRPRMRNSDAGIEADFLVLAKAAFAHRRKKLANSLRYHEGIAPMADEILATAGVDGSCRAEDLGVEIYEELVRVWHSMKGSMI